jgi:NAD(P) transhydrogenase subunit alpha
MNDIVTASADGFAATIRYGFDNVMPAIGEAAGGGHSFVSLLTIFALACFVGYYVVWRVTPALHSPLMAVTNAVSSVIIVGALLAAGLEGFGAAKIFGAIAVALAAVNIFGGFIVTQRMLSMFRKKTPANKK